MPCENKKKIEYDLLILLHRKKRISNFGEIAKISFSK
jgi:hypothetical protein